ncbi:hypothetical protein ZWY2020_020960, partial [Hordeum vulgare]
MICLDDIHHATAVTRRDMWLAPIRQCDVSAPERQRNSGKTYVPIIFRSRGSYGPKESNGGRTHHPGDLWALPRDLIGFAINKRSPTQDLYDPGSRCKELYSPPTTHFVATIEDLTNLLDFSSEE